MVVNIRTPLALVVVLLNLRTYVQGKNNLLKSRSIVVLSKMTATAIRITSLLKIHLKRLYQLLKAKVVVSALDLPRKLLKPNVPVGGHVELAKLSGRPQALVMRHLSLVVHLHDVVVQVVHLVVVC